ncbi:hypothetical protein EDB92DRAFT_1895990, partial [Lactarius akahatsu]
MEYPHALILTCSSADCDMLSCRIAYARMEHLLQYSAKMHVLLSISTEGPTHRASLSGHLDRVRLHWPQSLPPSPSAASSVVARQSGPLSFHSISLVLATRLASGRAVRTDNASTMPGLEIIPRIGPTSSNMVSMHTMLQASVQHLCDLCEHRM